MTVTYLLKKLKENGIQLRLMEGKLKAYDPHKKMDRTILEEIKTHKETIIELLSETPDFTPSDFPHATSAIDQDRLDEILSDHPALERLYVSTPMQQGMIFLGLLEGNAASYTSQVFMDFNKRLESTLFKRAWEYVAARHDIFRTCFVALDSEAIHQLVVDHVDIPFEEEDLCGMSEPQKMERIKQYREEDMEVGFDFSAPPLMRLKLFRLSQQSYHLVWSHHHVILDGWCLPIVLREVFATYQAFSESRQPIFTDITPYESYIAWLQQKDQAETRAFWTRQLSGIAAPTPLMIDKLPIDDAVSGKQELTLSFDEEISGQLEILARDSQTTLSVIVQAAWAYVLHRYSGEDDVVFGSLISGRPGDLPGVETMLGLFINTVPVRVTFDSKLNLSDLLSSIHRDNIGREEHGYLSLVEVQGLSDVTAGTSLFDSIFIYANYPTDLSTVVRATSEDNNVSDELFDLKSFGLDGETNYKLSLFANYRDDVLTIKMTYRAEEFSAETIDSLLGHVERVLIGMVTAGGNQAVNCLPLLKETELNQLLHDWNDTEIDYARDKCIHDLFEEQASANPDAVALVFEDKQLTYNELNNKANQVAHHLLQQGVTPNTLVGLCVERSLEMVIGMLGILKSGAAYLPLDPSYPLERIHYMLEDSKVNYLVTQKVILAMLPDNSVASVLCIDEKCFLDTEASADQDNLSKKQLGLTPNDLAYLIYTSGSTGKPKGVMIHHKNVLNFFNGLDQEFGSSEQQDTWLAVTSICFDISVLEIFWTLGNGHKVVMKSDPPVSVKKNQSIDFGLFYFAANEVEAGSNKYELLLEGAKFADQNGLSSVWIPERHFSQMGHQFPSSSVAASAVAATTDKIKIRSGSVVLPLHDPIRVAEEWSMVDNLSNGRIEMALASGWHPNDFVLMPDAYQERHKILDEKLTILKDLWQGKGLTRKNGINQSHEIFLHPKPLQQDLKVWITAAGSPETFRYAGSIGANVLTHLLGQTSDELKEKIDIYRDALVEAGYERDVGKVALMLHTFVSDDVEFVYETIEQPFKNYLRHSFNLMKSIAENMGMDLEKDMEAIIDIGYQRYLHDAGLFGTPETCFSKVQELQECGVNEIACLIDFGVDCKTMLDSLPHLVQLQKKIKNHTAQQSFLDKRLNVRSSAQELIVKHQVTHMQCTPSYVREWGAREEGQAALEQLSSLLVGGETLTSDLAESLTQHVSGRVFNMYGPTETTVWSAISTVSEKRVRLGNPIKNTQFYVLDNHRRLVPKGIIGELYIGGDGLSSGYFNRPKLTDAQFVQNPFSDNSDHRLYKTGDLVRHLANGELEFLGRMDQQVKVLGYRIELGEIEAVLAEAKEVQQVAVIVKYGVDYNSSIVAYLILAGSNEAGATRHQAIIRSLRNDLQRRLPNYMVPGAFIVLNEMPLTSNGKLDRKALKALKGESVKTSIYVAARNDIEEKLCEIWQEVLKVERVSIYDNFFELGGHSLLIVQAGLKINMLFTHIQIDIENILSSPTVAELATYFKEDANAEEDNDVVLQQELNSFNYSAYESINRGNYSNPSAILITNISELVGIQLLKKLLENTSAKIYCLVEAEKEDCEGRVRSACQQYDVDIEENEWERIEGVPCDLKREHLGISLVYYQQIISSVDIIVHNAERINHLQSYQQLKAENVSSTNEIIKIAKLVKSKKVILFSTTFLLNETPHHDEDSDMSSYQFKESQGYLASKWVAEALLKKSDIDFQIFRLPRVGGDLESDKGPLNELVYKFWRSCLMLKSYPAGLDEWKEDIRPVSQITKLIIGLMFKVQDNKSVFHLNNKSLVKVISALKTITDEIELKEVDVAQWLLSLNTERFNEQELPFASHADYLQSLLQGLKHNADDNKYVINNRKTMDLLEVEDTCFDFSQVQLRHYIKQCVEYEFFNVKK
ncbi:MAG: LLM class flavin-dependent oxidoreductase [Pseudomonadales bacterium]|nr:LLM class flavin-dependent oxidoreductase [Pseudomonadales bacterium]